MYDGVLPCAFAAGPRTCMFAEKFGSRKHTGDIVSRDPGTEAHKQQPRLHAGDGTINTITHQSIPRQPFWSPKVE